MKFLKELNLPNKLTLLRIALFVPMIILMIANIYILRTSDGHLWTYMKQEENYAMYEAGNLDFNFHFTYSLNGLYTKIGAIDIVILLFFIGAMVTDFLDGYLARKNNQVTEFGKLWDPLADKIITTLTLIYFAVMNYVPFWIVLIFVIRDLIVDGSRVTMAKNNIGVEASIWGKLKTLIMTAGIIIVFIYQLVFSFNIKKITYFDKSAQSWAPFVVSIPLLVAAGSFLNLKTDIAAEVFSYLEDDAKTKLVHSFTEEWGMEIIQELQSDELADLLEDLPVNLTRKILAEATEEKREKVNSILTYSDDQVGSIMSVDISILKSNWTCKKALRQIKRDYKKNAEMSHSFYITDEKGIFLGSITLEELVFNNDEDDLLEDLYTVVATVHPYDDKEDAARCLEP